MATYSSAMISISRFTKGTKAFLPIKCLKRSSLGFTQIAASAKMVSGRVVAITTKSEILISKFEFSLFFEFRISDLEFSVKWYFM